MAGFTSSSNTTVSPIIMTPPWAGVNAAQEPSPMKGGIGPLIDLDFDVGPGLADLEDIFIGDHCAFEARGLLDGGGVQCRALCD